MSTSYPVTQVYYESEKLTVGTEHHPDPPLLSTPTLVEEVVPVGLRG